MWPGPEPPPSSGPPAPGAEPPPGFTVPTEPGAGPPVPGLGVPGFAVPGFAVQTEPPPPPGPGVRVPFAAPPTERDRKRLWIGLGVGGAALLLCCVGGLVGFGALAVIGQRALPSQARTVVGDYLDRLSQQEWGDAYDLLCRPRRQREELTSFTDRQEQYPQIDSYAVATPVQKAAPFVVTAQVRDRDGDVEDEAYQVVTESGQLKVCSGTR